MINENLTYAAIGASQDSNKYGHKVFRDLFESGHKVIPINPKEGTLLGEKVYRSVAQYPNKIDVAIFVVPPQVTLKILEQVKEKEIPVVWMQPGSESKAAIAKCHDLGLECVSNACIMVQRQSKQSHESLDR